MSSNLFRMPGAKWGFVGILLVISAAGFLGAGVLRNESYDKIASVLFTCSIPFFWIGVVKYVKGISGK